MMIAGIDYGSKFAGTTAICYNQTASLYVIQSQKKQDADHFIRAWVSDHNPELIMLDAPLSLPLAYSDPSGSSDYHYRVCDRELKAMSPMFLGGLTARAMKLKSQLIDKKVLETYPKQVLTLRYPHSVASYKQDIMQVVDDIIASIPYQLHHPLTSWHQVDSLLAWISGYQYANDNMRCSGNPDEGLIYY